MMQKGEECYNQESSSFQGENIGGEYWTWNLGIIILFKILTHRILLK